MKIRHFIVWGVLLAAAPVLAGEDIDERRDLASDGSVSVSNVAGDIDISTWDRAEIHLTGELGEKSRLDIRETSGGIRIEVMYPNHDGRRGGDYEESDLVLVVPEGASISASGVSSDITIRGSNGADIVAETVSGDVDVQANTQRADLSSVSGDVDFSGSSPRTSVETVSGDIDLHGVNGELDVSLVSGDVDLGGGNFSRGTFESVSGTIDIAMEVAAGGRLTVESMSGDVILALPAGQGGEIRAQTFSGDIDSEFGRPESNEHGPGAFLEHGSGADSTSIRLETFSGDIRIGHK